MNLPVDQNPAAQHSPMSEPSVGPAPGPSTEQRVGAQLERLESLTALLVQDSYEVPPRDYDLPDDFCLSVVMPVYNEQATLRTILSRVIALPFPKEVIIVDDCSRDGTREILKSLPESEQLRVIYQTENQGKGAALRAGMQEARGDVVVIQDADLEYDPRDLVEVVRPLVQDEADVVYGSRFLDQADQDPSRLHRFGNRMLTLASNLTTGLKLTDMETCYKAFRREVLQGMKLKQNRFGFEPEITAKIARRKYRVKEVSVTYDARSYEEGKKIGWRDGLNALYCILRYALID